jgi:hypothetical protein
MLRVYLINQVDGSINEGIFSGAEAVDNSY